MGTPKLLENRTSCASPGEGLSGMREHGEINDLKEIKLTIVVHRQLQGK